MLGFSKLKGLLSGQPWSQMEWHLFCYIFCLMLNSASIAVWGGDEPTGNHLCSPGYLDRLVFGHIASGVCNADTRRAKTKARKKRSLPMKRKQLRSLT